MAHALWRLFRSGGDRVLTAAALAAIVAMLAAGLFEYNFGDSEFLMLFLVLVTLPFAASINAPATDRILIARAGSPAHSPAPACSWSATRCSTGSSSGG